MEILLNDKSVEITLENERTVGDVVNELLHWLRSNSMAVTTVTVDDNPMLLNEHSELADRSLDSVGQIRVEAMTEAELSASALATVRDYFRLVYDTLADGDDDTYAQLAPQFTELRPIVAQRLPDVMDVGFENGVDLLQQFPNRPPEGEYRDRMSSSVDRMSRIADSRLRELMEPGRELANTAKTMRELFPQLSEASILLQTGKENEAMELLYRFSELASKLLRLLPQTLPETNQSNTSAAFHESLSELLKAFEASDTVLIGDLIEYEIVPKTEAMLDEIEQDDAASGDLRASPTSDTSEGQSMG